METVSSIKGNEIVYNTTIFSWKAGYGDLTLACKPLVLICLQTWTKREALFEGSGYFYFEISGTKNVTFGNSKLLV